VVATWEIESDRAVASSVHPRNRHNIRGDVEHGHTDAQDRREGIDLGGDGVSFFAPLRARLCVWYVIVRESKVRDGGEMTQA
jgi:hypothetical protein